MKKYWSICACFQYADGEVLDKKEPFKHYNIEAKNAKSAIERLKAAMPSCIVTVAGKPKLVEISEKEYNNG